MIVDEDVLILCSSSPKTDDGQRGHNMEEKTGFLQQLIIWWCWLDDNHPWSNSVPCQVLPLGNSVSFSLPICYRFCVVFLGFGVDFIKGTITTKGGFLKLNFPPLFPAGPASQKMHPVALDSDLICHFHRKSFLGCYSGGNPGTCRG